jgi:hypothetical protein
MVNVNTFKIFTDGVANKVQSGNSVSPEQKDEFYHRSQMQIFEKDRLTFLRTGESSDFLDTFLVSTTLNPSSSTGYAPYPSGFQHTAGVRAYLDGKEREVEPVTNQAWGSVQTSELNPPTRTFPKYTEFANEYRFLPRNINIVMLDYWKEPVKPIWGWTIVNNVQVYDASTSTNFEFDNFSFNAVAAVYLSLIGINLKDAELEQFSQQFGSQNNTIL